MLSQPHLCLQLDLGTERVLKLHAPVDLNDGDGLFTARYELKLYVLLEMLIIPLGPYRGSGRY